MREVIPFYKEIVFKTNIASITSISLEHEEKVFNGEVSGDFIIFGDYKVHNDTTERELFRYRLPFTAIIPDYVDKDTIVVDIENFTYEQIENDVLKVNIDFSIQGEIIEKLEVEVENNRDELLELNEDVGTDYCVEEKEEDLIDKEINNILGLELENDKNVDFLDERMNVENLKKDDNQTIDSNNEDNTREEENKIILEKNEEIKKEEVIAKVQDSTVEMEEEYVTYHIHIVKESETIENIIKAYNINLEYLKEYNDISEIKVGDKIIIPEYGDE